jgi:divalent metal cation (Fe/Co/Zn/Cd) transporter
MSKPVDPATDGHGSLVAILWALGANAGIAVAKFAAAFYTGSGAMLAEAIHSLADCANQVLLLVGMRQARDGVSEVHPLGTGRVVYFYAMMVAIMLFALGGAFSVYEGIQRLRHPEPVASC